MNHTEEEAIRRELEVAEWILRGYESTGPKRPGFDTPSVPMSPVGPTHVFATPVQYQRAVVERLRQRLKQ